MMPSVDLVGDEPITNQRNTNFKRPRLMNILIVIAAMLGAALLALNITSIIKMTRTQNGNEDIAKQMKLNDQRNLQQSINADMVSSIRIQEVMSYLNEFQRIANAHDRNRAYNTIGFNQTLDYITNYLVANTNFRVSRAFFKVRNFEMDGNPTLISSINGVIREYTYSTDLSRADFYFVKYSTAADLDSFSDISVIPNAGCDDDDWNHGNVPPKGRIVLVKRGVCPFRDKANLAAKYGASGVLLYNDGITPERMAPIEISLSQENDLPALFLSHSVGQALATAASRQNSNTSVKFRINVKNIPPSDVGNICADTPTGDPTKTIVIGSHSDSVPAGPGINDNGSGSAANLALAVTLARLFRTPAYPKYRYRIRFCWWGAEEVGLLGSQDHVNRAKVATQVGERLQDYLINLNYDMLGSPNFIFGVYDGRTARNDTPVAALPGSNKITALFRDWFIGQNLPWDYTDFSGRSDYGPFLAEGIVAGGLFSGGDDTKTQQQRDRYDAMMGQGLGGIPDIIMDPCYHKACDTVQNINVLGYEKMIQAAAYVLEYLGRLNDLELWLYPDGRNQIGTHAYHS